ncbi:B-cell receptor CD22-like [Bufo bufo]|uniref:B-cell receptor CD22-like n=1 Tax=Bufo bufo TaxID=8384 RepID=UPI001ABEB6D4|nr:B-cell receptor CD22-like [Bufo bufo]
MAGVKQMFLLITFQGFYLGSVCQEWTFPSTITALIGSCVEIPCTYHPARTSGTSSTVWYLYNAIRYPEILNTKDSSSVRAEYRDRTSLVPGENSCTLRIDPVRGGDGDKYYPGIAEEKKTNTYDKQSRTVHLRVTDILGKFDLHVPQILTEGEATNIRCTAEHTCPSSPPSLQWNKPGQIQNKSVDITGGIWREESMLTYIPSYLDDGTSVQCTATYPNGQKTERPEILNIKYAPKNVTITGNSELMEGSDVTLQCNSFSKPEVDDYEWYKGKTKLPDRGQKITVRNVTWDMKPYSCAVRNYLGRGKSAPTEIPVLYAAIGVHITMKKEHEISELVCDFLSSRPDITHYTWMKDGSILLNEMEKTLTININEENYGQYSCIAHNIAGNSSSEEICIKREKLDLPLILGTVAGCLFLILLIVIIYFCVRQICKSYFPAFRKYTPAARSPSHNTTAIDEALTEENQYGNICSDHNAQPDSISLKDVNFKDNYVIYSNSEVMQPTNEVEYSDICHVQHDRMTSSRVDYGHNVEYATLRL